MTYHYLCIKLVKKMYEIYLIKWRADYVTNNTDEAEASWAIKYV